MSTLGAGAGKTGLPVLPGKLTPNTRRGNRSGGCLSCRVDTKRYKPTNWILQYALLKKERPGGRVESSCNVATISDSAHVHTINLDIE